MDKNLLKKLVSSTFWKVIEFFFVTFDKRLIIKRKRTTHPIKDVLSNLVCNTKPAYFLTKADKYDATAVTLSGSTELITATPVSISLASNKR